MSHLPTPDAATGIRLSRVHFPVTTLGPGRRLGIWFQGCSLRCAGCVSADTWAPGRHSMAVAELVAQLLPWLDEAEGITISGGEPFDQPEALIALLRALKAHSPLDIFVFTGHPVERLADALVQAQGLLDALMSDPFDIQAPQTRALRGSDNQRLHVLTDLGRTRFAAYDRDLTPDDRTLDLMFDDDGTVWLAGIPRRDDVLRLHDLLETQGHDVVVTADRPHPTDWKLF